MKIYAAYKNDQIIRGKIFGRPVDAVNFFKEEFLKEYPNANINDIYEELLDGLEEEGYFSIQTGEDEWGCNTYISDKSEEEAEE